MNTHRLPGGRPCTAAEYRDFLIFYARVMLREARARRHHEGGVEWMLRAARNARREAAAIRPAQGELL